MLDIAIEQVLLKQGHNVCSTEWGKALSDGLYEFRVRRTLSVLCEAAGIEIPTGLPAHQRILLRVFFAVEGVKIVVLLGGYDKGKDDSSRRQAKEIALARSLLRQHRLEQRQARKS